MAKSRTIIHDEYRYKPKGSKDYVTLYHETGSTDVKIETANRPDLYDLTSLHEVLLHQKQLIKELNNLKTQVKPSNSIDWASVPPKGKIIVESDTYIMRVGDGETMYIDLPGYTPTIFHDAEWAVRDWYWGEISIPNDELDHVNTHADTSTVIFHCDDGSERTIDIKSLGTDPKTDGTIYVQSV